SSDPPFRTTIGSKGRTSARRYARRFLIQTKAKKPSAHRMALQNNASGIAIQVEPRRATPVLSPPDCGRKSCGPVTAPPPNVAEGLKESISQRPSTFLTVP